MGGRRLRPADVAHTLRGRDNRFARRLGFSLLTHPRPTPPGTGDHQQQRARRARPDHDAARRHGRQHHAAAQHVAQDGQSGRLCGVFAAPYLATTGSSDCIRRLEAALRTREEGPGASDHRRKRRLSSDAAPNSLTMFAASDDAGRATPSRTTSSTCRASPRVSRATPSSAPSRSAHPPPYPHPHPSQPPGHPAGPSEILTSLRVSPPYPSPCGKWSAPLPLSVTAAWFTVPPNTCGGSPRPIRFARRTSTRSSRRG